MFRSAAFRTSSLRPVGGKLEDDWAAIDRHSNGALAHTRRTIRIIDERLFFARSGGIMTRQRPSTASAEPEMSLLISEITIEPSHMPKMVVGWSSAGESSGGGYGSCGSSH